MTNRRDFLTTLGAALGATALGSNRAFAAGLDAKKLSRIGIQLYTVRSLTEKNLEGTLASLAGIGYKEVEFAGYFGRTPAQVRAMLKENKLTSPSTHIPLPANSDSWKKSCDEAKAIGHEWVVVPWLAEPQRPVGDAWGGLADRFNALAKIAKAHGLKFAYHNHDFEFAKAGKATALDLLLARTDPKLVDFEMDLYWVYKGGGDPLDFFKRYAHRFPLLHVKDATAAPARDMVDVGSGTIDFGKIFAKAGASGQKHIYVEHDNPKDPLATATASYKHLAALSF